MDRQHRDVNTDPHKPWDSTLLGDAERVLERLMIEACKHISQLRRTCHRRVVKKQIMAIRNCTGEDQRRAHYGKLIRSVRHTFSAVQTVIATQQQSQDWTNRYFSRSKGS